MATSKCRLHEDCILEYGHSGLCAIFSEPGESKARSRARPTTLASTMATASSSAQSEPADSLQAGGRRATAGTSASAQQKAPAASSPPKPARELPSAVSPSSANVGGSGACGCDACARENEPCGVCEACLGNAKKQSASSEQGKAGKKSTKEEKCFKLVCHNHHMAFANMLVRTKDYARALTSYDEALKLPTSMASTKALILRNRAFCLTSVGRFTEAVADAEVRRDAQPQL
jgi:hypothetical protein